MDKRTIRELHNTARVMEREGLAHGQRERGREGRVRERGGKNGPVSRLDTLHNRGSGMTKYGHGRCDDPASSLQVGQLGYRRHRFSLLERGACRAKHVSRENTMV